MIDNIDFDKLLPYREDKRHSFEELCYQLCLEEFNGKGDFTSIDDSGGGDGVEFYLTLPTGEVLGWQCKFFDRLDQGGRKEQIKRSLKKAYEIHGDRLKLWYLCSKSSLTVAEKQWFDNQLPSSVIEGVSVIPPSASIELKHWGDSEILNLLRKHISIFNFFFNDQIQSFKWFEEKAKETFSKKLIKSKYDKDLYCRMDLQDNVDCYLGGKKLASVLKERRIKGFLSICDEYHKQMADLRKFKPDKQDYFIFSKIRNKFLYIGHIIDESFSLIMHFIDALENSTLNEQLLFASKIESYYPKIDEIAELSIELDSADEKLSLRSNKEKSSIRSKKTKSLRNYMSFRCSPTSLIRDYCGTCRFFIDIIKHIRLHEIHFTGNASQGKSNLALHLFENNINDSIPSIFLSAKDFKNGTALEDQILQLLDLPKDWTFNKFLGILDSYGKLSNSKPLFIIDGLNENIYWKEIWSSNIDRLISVFNHYPHIMFVSTYRLSYEKEIFTEHYFSSDRHDNYKRIQVSGINIDIHEAIDKYSRVNKVKVTRLSSSVQIFQKEPLCLKLFFESHKGQAVELVNDTVIKSFTNYIERCKDNICGMLGMKYGKGRISLLLEQLVKYLWDNDSYGIPLGELTNFSQPELEAFDHEDLLLYREYSDIEEFRFTYDLLAGFLIANMLLKEINSRDDLNSQVLDSAFQNKIINKQNPLFDVISNNYLLLATRKFGISCCVCLPFSDESLINAIYEAPSYNIDQGCIEIQSWIEQSFEKSPAKLIPFFFNTALLPENKLNFEFSSYLLKKMSLTDRDLFWTEFIRMPYKNNYLIDAYIKELETQCKSTDADPDILNLGALVVMWCLTSVDHQQRFNASKSLYWYGRNYPIDFLKMVEHYCDINDPYVQERLYGIGYGIALTFQNRNIKDPIISGYLFPLAKIVINKFFRLESDDRCHYLSRIYCRGIVKLAIRFGFIVTEEEKQIIFSPIPRYETETIDSWEEVDGFDNLIRMDFSNYQLGNLIDGGYSYSNPPLKKKSRWYLHHRIRQLGWNEDQFEEIDNNIGNGHWSATNDKSKIDRYGKKYSWIAYYQLAGILEDVGFLQKKWDFPPVMPDFDPSFPEIDYSCKLVTNDFLGDDAITAKEWIENDSPIDLNSLLYGTVLRLEKTQFICIYGYFTSKNHTETRSRFTYVRPLIVKDEDYDEFKGHLYNQDLRGRWLPEIRENHYLFADEMYLDYVKHVPNYVKISFVIECEQNQQDEISEEIENFKFEEQCNSENFKDFIQSLKNVRHKTPITKDFEVLLPTMEYNFDNDFTDGIGRCISYEIASTEGLLSQPQTFELIDKDGIKASINYLYNEDHYNHQHFVFLRKDILDHYLKSNKMKMIWAIWGERQYPNPPFINKVFQQFEDYN